MVPTPRFFVHLCVKVNVGKYDRMRVGRSNLSQNYSFNDTHPVSLATEIDVS